MLRIDVNAPDAVRAYGIPAGNMTNGLPELWSVGFRNPWRFSFDGCTGDMYIGDVGESRFERAQLQTGKLRRAETTAGACSRAQLARNDPNCSKTGYTLPTFEYEHDVGCAVISGYVYRGHRIPALRGTYLYTDYCTGELRSLRIEAGRVAQALDITDVAGGAINLVTSFGVDNAGELYVLTQPGSVYRIDPDE